MPPSEEPDHERDAAERSAEDERRNCEEGAKENGKDCKSGTWEAILKETMEE